ncbi:MAG: acyl-CoA thioesterase [Leptolyngbyaceae cyanobacterium SL_7_1]|nr:acyl-CoA thioesterase [Leptolyngbyaceae cyanobacterium SL_7_1]
MFIYLRTVRFQDTDAAGVVYFANGLTLCHEAYEASLAESGIPLRSFFSGAIVAVPIVHASIDFLQPLYCGDRLLIHLTPKLSTPFSFEIAYQLRLQNQPEQLISRATTRHVCINAAQQSKIALIPELMHWLDQWQV